MDGAWSSEIPVSSYQTTRCHNPGDHNLDFHCCKNHKSYVFRRGFSKWTIRRPPEIKHSSCHFAHTSPGQFCTLLQALPDCTLTAPSHLLKACHPQLGKPCLTDPYSITSFHLFIFSGLAWPPSCDFATLRKGITARSCAAAFPSLRSLSEITSTCSAKVLQNSTKYSKWVTLSTQD